MSLHRTVEQIANDALAASLPAPSQDIVQQKAAVNTAFVDRLINAPPQSDPGFEDPNFIGGSRPIAPDSLLIKNEDQDSNGFRSFTGIPETIRRHSSFVSDNAFKIAESSVATTLANLLSLHELATESGDTNEALAISNQIFNYHISLVRAANGIQ